MKLAIIAAALAVMLAVPAHADTDDTDAAYLKALHSHGLSAQKGDSELIGEGHAICTALGQGYSMNALAAAMNLHEANGTTDDDMEFIVKVAAASYCPQYIK